MPRTRGKYDQLLIEYLEEYRAITIEQATVLFFKDYKYASKRLLQLEKLKVISSYIDPLLAKRVYYLHHQKPLSAHDFLIVRYMYKLMTTGYKIKHYKWKPPYDAYGIEPDLRIIYTKIDDQKEIHEFVEVDHTHFTTQVKVNQYDKIYVNRRELNINKFDLVIIKETPPKVKSECFNIIHLDTDLKRIY